MSGLIIQKWFDEDLDEPVESGNITGSGALICAAAVIAGVGLSVSIGSGALVTQNSIIVGAGLSVSQGSGALIAFDSAVAGAGLSKSIGAGALNSDDSHISGAGTVGGGVSPVEEPKNVKAILITGRLMSE